jgi:hypothetical protein
LKGHGFPAVPEVFYIRSTARLKAVPFQTWSAAFGFFRILA